MQRHDRYVRIQLIPYKGGDLMYNQNPYYPYMPWIGQTPSNVPAMPLPTPVSPIEKKPSNPTQPNGNGTTPGMTPGMLPGVTPPSQPPVLYPPTGTPIPTGTGTLFPDIPSTDGPPAGRDVGYIQAYLARNIGNYVKIEFLLGTNMLVDREGTIREVGTNYVVIQEPQTDDLLMCDLYSIKFVRVYY